MAQAQVLWNGASFGMTPAEVTNIFPQAGQGERDETDTRMTVRVNDLRAAGHNASVLFDFEQNKLTRVRLILTPQDPGAPIDPDDIRRGLTSKYGAPTRCDDTIRRCEWRAGDLDIELDGESSKAGEAIDIVYGSSPGLLDGNAADPGASASFISRKEPG
jgi:hypothetical protein